MRLTLHVWRQKGKYEAGRFVTYDVPDVSEHMSFLEMLDVLNQRLILKGEEPIAFDHDCREGICGMCGFMINGQAHGPLRGTTVCQLHMRHYKDGDVLWLEPWRAQAFPVVSDLAVDRSAFDRIIAAGGFVSVSTGSAPDANAIPVPTATCRIVSASPAASTPFSDASPQSGAGSGSPTSKHSENSDVLPLRGLVAVAVITSPCTTPPDSERRNACTPARAAGLPGVTSTTPTPLGSLSASLTCGGSAAMPSTGRTTLPSRISRGTTRLTSSTGIAKPMPALAPLGLAICVFTPIKRPALSRSGPPRGPEGRLARLELFPVPGSS